MPSEILSLTEIFSRYKSWVSKNPQTLCDWENSAKWISYFFAGRINNSQVVSELVYCLSNLLVLFNDNIIKRTRQDSTTTAEKIKLWLSILEYSEVFCELSAKKLWGVTGKWLVVVSIQIYKCISRFLLIYHYKEPIIQSPAIPVLDRRNINNNGFTTVDDIATSQFENVSFTLKRSGRAVRKVDSSPPIALRRWKPLKGVLMGNDNNQSIEVAVESRHRIAETIYMAKPMVHLASMACFGTNTWKPWLISLCLDLTSMQLYRFNPKKKFRNLTPQQRLQLSKRTVAFILYLIRSPVYERHSKDRINALLMALTKQVPFAGLICSPLAQYLPFWQSTYFYMWST